MVGVVITTVTTRWSIIFLELPVHVENFTPGAPGRHSPSSLSGRQDVVNVVAYFINMQTL